MVSQLLGPNGNPILSAQDAGSTSNRASSYSHLPRHPRLVNPVSGAGGVTDKDLGSQFFAYRMPREEAERTYAMSWAAQKMIDILIDDMFWKGRVFTGNDEGAIKAFEDAERDLDVMKSVPAAMKAGRLFGSALLIVCPHETNGEGEFDTPMKPEDYQEDGIANLWVVDRWACSVQNWQTNPFLPNYGQVYQYRVNARIFGSPNPLMDGVPGVSTSTASGHYLVNADRVFRFDGTRSPLTEGWTTGPWEREWGVSVLTKAIDAILREASTNAGVGHLVQEASIWIQKIQNFKEAIRGRPAPGEPTAEEIAEETNLLKSLYHVLFMDSEDDAERVNVTWAGLPDIMDKQWQLLAAIAEVPMTRYMSQSPAGMNATGSSDANNWALTVSAAQKRDVDPVFRRLDMMVARHAGLSEPPEYDWVPLTDLSEKDKAETAKLEGETLNLAYTDGVIDEDEYRERLSQNEFWGELGSWAGPNQMQELEFEREDQKAAEQAEKMKALSSASPNGNGNGNGGPPMNGNGGRPNGQ